MKVIVCLVLLLSIAKSFGQDACKGNPNKKDPMECCDIPMPSMEVFEKCEEQFGEQTKKCDELGIEHGCCISECTLNATKIYSGNGIIDKVVLAKTLLDAGGAEWKDKLPGIMEECFKQAGELSEEFKKQFESAPAFPGEKMCHPISGFMMVCMFHGAFKQCPDAKYTKDAQCDALKAYAQKCPLDFGDE